MMEDDAVIHSHVAAGKITRPTLGRFMATFGFAWLMIGLFTGTIVLVVLVRWLVNLLHHWGLGQTAENRTLMLVIVLFIAGSFLLTRNVVRNMFRMESPKWRRATLGSLVIPGVLSLWAWSNPTRVLASLAGSESSSVGTVGGPQFIFGSYPDADRLAQLKREGVTTVVSLQHPAVLVELQGIKDEREAAERLGLRFVQAPMLPWVSDNSQSLATIRQIAESRAGKFYIHCGLGRDRVNIAKRVVESVVDSAHARVVANGVQQALGFEERAATAPFERGKLLNLAPDVWLIPFPNPAEMHGFILQGRAGHVFMLLDSRDTLEQRWRRLAEEQFHEYVIPFTYVPFGPSDSARATTVAAQIRAQQPPVTVIVPSTTWGDPSQTVTSRATAAMLKAFGKIPADAAPRLVPPTSSLHERTLEMQEAASPTKPANGGSARKGSVKRKSGRRA